MAFWWSNNFVVPLWSCCNRFFSYLQFVMNWDMWTSPWFLYDSSYMSCDKTNKHKHYILISVHSRCGHILNTMRLFESTFKEGKFWIGVLVHENRKNVISFEAHWFELRKFDTNILIFVMNQHICVMGGNLTWTSNKKLVHVFALGSW